MQKRVLNKTHRSVSWLFVLTTLLLPVFVQAESDTVRECHNLYRLTDLSHAVEPGVWVEAADGVPAHCRLRGVVNRAIRVEVTLPESWNRRMMFSTVGGNAGMFGDTRSLLSKGFAMATTDTGHEGQDSGFMRQPEALIDYAYRGVHLATVFAKQVITSYYGNDINHAYLQGCSNGGRAALMEALRFPQDYDGIIAGAPAFRLQEFFPWTLNVQRAQLANPLTLESLKILGAASRESCDLLDGVEDGVINDPRQCTADVFELTKLECRAGQADGCLTAGQIETARTMYTDLVDADGTVISPGVMPGAEDATDWAIWLVGERNYNAALGLAEGPLNGLVLKTFADLLYRDVTLDIDVFDPLADRGKFDDVAAFIDIDSADLNEFRAQGGKLLMYQGWNDYPLRPQRAIDYLAEAEAASGGSKATSDFFRLFMVPGMNHCGGGPGPWLADYVEPIVSWVEKDLAPERIVGTQPGFVNPLYTADDESSVDGARIFTRPLCSFPQYAKYSEQGNVNNGDNWRCVSD
jgi:pimeloyl-ACP methyl ester carboxylesterase